MKTLALTSALAFALALAGCVNQRPAYWPTQTTSGVLCQQGYEVDKDGQKCVPLKEVEFDVP